MQKYSENKTKHPYLIKSDKVCQLLGIHRSTLWRWRKEEKDNFPKPVKLSPNVWRWRFDDVLAFADNGIEGGEQ